MILILRPKKLDEQQDAEIAELRLESAASLRPSYPGIEQHLHIPYAVLDHGFVRVVDYMGGDASIVQAARVSYGKGTRQTSEDAGLINYLMRHHHTTPFEMAEIKLHVKLPIFVARQWIRHRTASVNEYSGRYSVLDREFYVPSAENLAPQSTSNRQGRGDSLSSAEAETVLNFLRSESNDAYDGYLTLLNESEDGTKIDPDKSGIARELARINLGVNFYTQWYWKVNLHNLFGFLKLRADAHAQYEIRAYAETILAIVEDWAPVSAAAFKEHRLGAVHLSATAAGIIRRRIAGETITQADSGLSAREWRELNLAFGI